MLFKKDKYAKGNAALVKDSIDWLEELADEINKGKLEMDSDIYIVRDEEIWLSDTEPYCPIIDYYDMNRCEYLTTPLESSEDKSEYSDEEWEEMQKEHDELLQQYLDDKPDLIQIKVYEMFDELNLIINKLK